MSIRRISVLGCAALATLVSARAVAQANELDTAYKREFAFLEAERNTLKSRIEQVEREETEKIKQARAEITQLQARATGLTIEADKLQDGLSDIEQESVAQAETSDVLASTLQQAELALGKGGLKLPEVPENPTAEQRMTQLDAAFQHSVALLGKYASVREEPGEFFGSDGKKVAGTIVRVGQIAAYGVADNAAGALAPAGEDRLKIWPVGDSSGIARALAGGQPPKQLGIFMFESLEKEVEKPKEKTVEDLLKAGGAIGWVIVVLGIIAALMSVVRVILLLRAAGNTESLVNKIAPLLQKKQFAEALAEVKKSATPAGRVLEVTLKNLERPREQLEDMVAEAVMREQPTLDRFGAAIMIAAAVGPLLGLLGTVTGMISTFDVITEYGNSNPKLLAGGISEALVTTEFGLLVAIPMLLIGNLLSGWAQRIKDDIDGAALRVTNIANGNDVRHAAERPSLAGGGGGSPELAPAE
jgi:biopolymer transport protein ExbB